MLTCFMPTRERILKTMPDCNPRHVQALMESQHGELNWWLQRAFAKAVAEAAERAAADPVEAERIAQALGL